MDLHQCRLKLPLREKRRVRTIDLTDLSQSQEAGFPGQRHLKSHCGTFHTTHRKYTRFYISEGLLIEEKMAKKHNVSRFSSGNKTLDRMFLWQTRRPSCYRPFSQIPIESRINKLTDPHASRSLGKPCAPRTARKNETKWKLRADMKVQVAK